MECIHCSSIRKNANSLRNHERTCPNNPNRVYKNGMTGKIGSNQFKKARLDGTAIPISHSKGKKTGRSSAPKSPEAIEKLRSLAIDRNLGGVRQSKRIQYKDTTLGSSYELAVAKSLDEHNVKWSTCQRIKYIDPLGKSRTYTPDFYLPEYNVYLDPKNDFLIKNINPSLGFTDKEKISLVEKQNKIKILILNKHQLDWTSIQELL